MNTREKESNATHGTVKEAISSQFSRNDGGANGGGNIPIEHQSQPDDKPNEEMLEKYEIPDTPFTAVRFADKWMLTMGRYKLDTDLISKEECITAAFDTSWNRILQVVGIMIESWNVKEQREVERLMYENDQLKKALGHVGNPKKGI